ncbi:hypothetical protein PVK06_019317 [Gossypium arboreum]|uniref:Uncharacterized protein n=1 Tax=Gossypium arboreum TaxID=29729 RepID=A0ABR0PJF6_GOSAR|nr:hypothetical protein PVK06_019317 [Gossypium arboreum]
MIVGSNKKKAFAHYVDRIHCFLSMGLSSYPSLTWRGIVSARDLLEKGMGWRIGNRETMNIWNDHWIPRPGDGQL